MDYDAIVIGAGMSGLAAGIRLAQFDLRVCIVERHYNFGGLNSFYTLGGRRFDVGLHALTNFVKPGVRDTPLPKLLRQLRISRDALDLCEQNYSAISFPGRRIRFSNDVQLLIDEIAREFPDEVDNFLCFVEAIKAYDDLDPNVEPRSTRKILADYFKDHTLIDMLLCPLMYYGCSEQHDMDFTQFVTMFKSIFLQGFARPKQGVRRIVAELVKRYRACGGEFRMRCGVRRLNTDERRVTGIELDDGEMLTAGTILSSAGYYETMRLLQGAAGFSLRDPANGGDRSRREVAQAKARGSSGMASDSFPSWSQSPFSTPNRLNSASTRRSSFSTMPRHSRMPNPTIRSTRGAA